MKIFHLINSLDDGGAERVLANLCLNDKDNSHVVCTLLGGGKYKNKLRSKSIQLYELNIRKDILAILKIFRLVSILKNEKPDILQTWLYHSDLIGGLFGRVLNISKIVWNVRHTDISSYRMKISTKLIVRFCAILSKYIPSKIIYCSEISRKIHERIGYVQEKSFLIHNGVNITQFKPNKKKSMSNILKIGMVGRYSQYKDHKRLVEFMAELKKNNIKFKCYLAGENIIKNNFKLLDLIKKNGVLSEIILLGSVEKIENVYKKLDIHVLLSHSESFPNVLAEAMACEIPCISSGEGEAKKILGKYGFIVDSRGQKQLIKTINKILKIKSSTSKWKKLKTNCRKHIAENFSLHKMLISYNSLWKSLSN